jgi:hypothetical protein
LSLGGARLRNEAYISLKSIESKKRKIIEIERNRRKERNRNRLHRK